MHPAHERILYEKKMYPTQIERFCINENMNRNILSSCSYKTKHQKVLP